MAPQARRKRATSGFRNSAAVARKWTSRGSTAPTRSESMRLFGWLMQSSTGPAAGTRSRWRTSTALKRNQIQKRPIARATAYGMPMASRAPASVMRGSARHRLDDHRGAVGEHLGDALGDLIGVVAHADDGVGPHLAAVLHHDLEGLLAGALAELRVQRDVPAEQGLDGGAEAADDAARAHGDAPDHAPVGGDAVALEAEGGGDPLRPDGHG